MKCHQRLMKEQNLAKDLASLSFDPKEVPLSEYVFSKDNYDKSISQFLHSYEWLQTPGVSPKWCFTVKLRGILVGVQLLNEPATYSKLLGDQTMKWECLIQRGATISYAHPHLGSWMLSKAIDWMVRNTDKRVFVGYSDGLAGEYGTIYQASNFKYLGDGWGTDYKYTHPTYRNGKEFCKHSLRRTSVLKSWCKQNGITVEKNWIKPNGFKDLSIIPQQIKQAWYEWGNKLVEESTKIKIPSKGKYVLVKGKNHKEQKYLNALCNFKTYPFPKRRGV